MKLLFVLPEYGADVRGGIATFYNNLLPGLVRAGCTVDVCLAHEYGRPVGGTEEGAVRIFHLNEAQIAGAKARLPQFAVFPQLQHILARAFAAFESSGCGRGYDIVETTDWGMLHVPWLIRETQPPIVVQLHSSNGQINYYESVEGTGLAGLTSRLLETSLLGRADELQSYGPANAAEWARLLGQHVCHIWPPFQAVGEMPAQLSPELCAESNGIVVGRIDNWKGPEVLCQAAQLLGERAPKILWVGKDSQRLREGLSTSQFLEAKYDRVWQKVVVPVGELSREATAKIQASAKFVVVPSRWDTFNLAAIEAMWARKVVICSEGAGASSLIEPGKNGFRFQSDNPEQLAKLLLEVDNLSPDARIQIGESAHETVVRELDVDRICALRIGRYQRLMDLKRIARQPHRWLDSLFASEFAEPPFAFLRTVPGRYLAQYALRRVGERFLHFRQR